MILINICTAISDQRAEVYRDDNQICILKDIKFEYFSSGRLKVTGFVGHHTDSRVSIETNNWAIVTTETSLASTEMHCN